MSINEDGYIDVESILIPSNYQGRFCPSDYLNDERIRRTTAMSDPIARKRLKKRMLDRWENEGGRIAADTTSADASSPRSEDKVRGRKRSSPSDNSTAGTPASPTERRKPAQK